MGILFILPLQIQKCESLKFLSSLMRSEFTIICNLSIPKMSSFHHHHNHHQHHHQYLYYYCLLHKILFLQWFHLNLFRVGLFGVAHVWWGRGKKAPLPKICHAYPTMMKLGTVIPLLKKIQKNI